jgi:hypothetical protein
MVPVMAGRGGKREGSGRKRGVKTAATIEKERIAAEIALRTQADARVNGVPLAKEVLDQFMQLFAGLAANFQPWPESRGVNPNYNENSFRFYAEAAVNTAHKLAPFQSPTFKAVQISAPPDLQPRSGDDAREVKGKVIDLKDPVAMQKAYLRMLAARK